MVDRTIASVGIRLQTEGGKEVKSDLDAIGKAGGEAIEKLDATTGKVDTGFTRLDSTVKGTRETFRLFGQQVSLIQGPLGGAAARLVNVSNSIRNFGLGLTVVTGGLAALGFTLGLAVRRFSVAEESILRLEGVLKATGSASGLARSELDDLARALGEDTLTNANEARDAISALSTFTSIQNELFVDSIKLAQDLSAVYGRDLRSSALLLGRALEDPVNGLESLTRIVGTGVVRSLREANTELVETGRIAEARANTIRTLGERLKGAAEAAAGGTAGRGDSLAEAWNEMLEQIGQTDFIINPVNASITGLTTLIRGLDDVVESLTETATAAQQVRRQAALESDELFSITGGRDPESSLADRALQSGLEAEESRGRLQEVAEARISGLVSATRELEAAESDRLKTVQEFQTELERELELGRLSETNKRVQIALSDQLKNATDEERQSAAATIQQIDQEAARRDRLAKIIADTVKERNKELDAIRKAGPRELRELAQEAQRVDREQRQQAEDLGETLQGLRDDLADVSDAERSFLEEQERLIESFKFFNVPVEEQALLLQQLRDNYEETSRAAAIFTNNVTDAFVDLARTGKLEIRSLIDSILEEFLRLQLQQALSPLFQGLTTGIASFFSPTATTPAGGGAQLGGSFRVPGAGSRDTVPVGFLASPNERVTIEPLSRQGGGGVQIIDQRGAGAPPIEQQAVAGPSGERLVRFFVRSEVSRAIGDGGLNQPLGTFGIRPQPIRRG